MPQGTLVFYCNTRRPTICKLNGQFGFTARKAWKSQSRRVPTDKNGWQSAALASIRPGEKPNRRLLAHFLHGLVERRPFLFQAFILDLPELGLRDLEPLGHDFI